MCYYFLQKRTGTIEELRAMGCNKFVICGGAGALMKGSKVGDVIVPTSAVRDEGTSYHYVEPSREIECHKEVLEAAIAILTEMEAAAFFAVSKYYDIPLVQLLYTGDDVSGWDSRNWNKQKNIRANLIDCAIELIKKF